MSQTQDRLKYYLVLNNDSAFNCTIPYKIEGKIIRAVKEDKTEHLIMWKDIRSINVIGSDGKLRDIKQISKKELHTLRHQAGLYAEHERWDSCFVVSLKRDTVWGRFRTTNYGNGMIAFDFLEEKGIWFAYSNGKEELIPSAAIRELHVISDTKEQYITVEGMLLRVIIEGKCKLLQGGSKKIYSSVAANGQVSSVVTGTYEPYYVLYKGILTEIKTQTGILNTAAMFRETCTAVFAECPAVVSKIANKEYGPYSIQKIVTEFNSCVK